MMMAITMHATATLYSSINGMHSMLSLFNQTTTITLLPQHWMDNLAIGIVYDDVIVHQKLTPAFLST